MTSPHLTTHRCCPRDCLRRTRGGRACKYSFVGGNNDPDGVPVDGPVEAINAVLRRECRR